MFMCTFINLHMMLLQTVPASCVLGSSWADWRRIFAQTKLVSSSLSFPPIHNMFVHMKFLYWDFEYS